MKQFTSDEITSMKNVDIRNVDKDALVDLRSVQIDASKPV